MLNVTLTVRNAALNISEDCEITINEKLQIKDLTMAIMNTFGWFIDDPFGETTHYQLRREGYRSATFMSEQRIEEAMFRNGEVVVIESNGMKTEGSERDPDVPYVLVPPKLD